MEEFSQLGPGLILVLIFIGLLGLFVFFRFIPIGLWITALASGVRVRFTTLFGMRFRKVNPGAIVNPLINAYKA
ncbi:MAG: flotillin-like FloA family protein, partial [Gemmatimonadales bacterium]